MRLQFIPHQTALIVVDVQVDFCAPYGSTAQRGYANVAMQALPQQINRFAASMQQLGLLLIYTQAIVNEAKMPANLRLFNQIKNIRRPTQLGTGGEDFYQLDIPDDAITLTKTYADAFAATPLKALLLDRDIKNILLCGVRSEICVDATARRANAEGFNVVVISDLIATRDANTADQDRALAFFDAYFGYVLTTQQCLTLLSADGIPYHKAN